MRSTVNKNTRGFTLIELMIVVAIVGVLTAIAVPIYTDQVRKARRTDAMDALLDCAAAQARNYTSASPPAYFTDITARAAGVCNGMASKEGFYNLAITNTACAGAANPWCFVIVATPDADGPQASDPECKSMAVDHRSNKSARDNADISAGNDTTAICWRS